MTPRRLKRRSKSSVQTRKFSASSALRLASAGLKGSASNLRPTKRRKPRRFFRGHAKSGPIERISAGNDNASIKSQESKMTGTENRQAYKRILLKLSGESFSRGGE